MSIIKASFLLFFFALLIVYYCVPKKAQWIVLLVGSAVFYLCGGVKTSFYIVITATSVYGAARWMESISAKQKDYLRANKEALSREEKNAYKKAVKAKRRAIMIACLVLNLGLLCVFKYLHFALESLNALLRAVGVTPIEDTTSLIVPLGISFYTFQSIGYLVDVYWENISAQRNYFKTLLFVSFFPQITQGPISGYDSLSLELYSEHTFKYENFARGFQRLLFGLMKKMVLANLLQPYITSIFTNYPKYTGITVLLGACAYTIQLYADFSGYMDIMCGACEMLGIRLTENFIQPYFSHTFAEYWRRWHITLGEWFKKYVYYPVAVAKWNQKFGKAAQSKLGKTAAKNLPATVALLVTWLCTGLWHGANVNYLVWGLANGLILIAAMWLEPIFVKCRTALKIREDSTIWHLFQTARTFALVTLVVKVMPDVGTLSDGLGLIRHIFTDHRIPHSLSALIPFSSKWAFFPGAVIAFLLMLTADLIARKRDVRDLFGKLPTGVRIALLVLLFFLIAAFGIPASNNMRGFMYAQF